jgi:hypothetical protein
MKLVNFSELEKVGFIKITNIQICLAIESEEE